MQFIGIVVKNNSAIAKVRTSRPESCKNCASSSVCNTREFTIIVKNDMKASCGDSVLIESENEKSTILYCCFIFLVPICIFFMAYFLYTVNEFFALISIPLGIGYFITMKVLNDRYKSPARIIKILKADEIISLCSQGENKNG